MKSWISLLFLGGMILGFQAMITAQTVDFESTYYEIKTVPVPDSILLEVGGLAFMPKGQLAIATRRGDVFIVDDWNSDQPKFNKFAYGLHEVLGLAYKEGSLYCTQRSELTKLTDTDGDGKANEYRTFAYWPLTSNYHEYSYGPALDSAGDFYVTTNLGFFGEQWWRGASRVPWRGWTLKIDQNGRIQPYATGMRSPAGIAVIKDEVFYTENQGDWIPSGGLWHLEKGDFTGNPGGLKWAHLPESPVQLTYRDFVKKIDIREEKRADGRYIKPENRIEEDYQTPAQIQDTFAHYKLPAVWLPHGILGISNAQPILIPDGHFGPFAGQILVGDQGMSMISRVMLEKVNGQYQGAAIAFRSGFQSGVLRMEWAPDQSLIVGETNRGWGSAGDKNEGLERLVWTGEVPFEIKTIKAQSDGFEIELTKAVDESSAKRLEAYFVDRFTYKYHPVYGSPPVDQQGCEVLSVQVSNGGKTLRLFIDNLKESYIHRLSLDGLRSKDDHQPLLHATLYYTLNALPEGPAAKKIKSKSTAIAQQSSQPKATQPSQTKPSDQNSAKPNHTQEKTNVSEAVITNLLTQYTCVVCHDTKVRKIGPSFVDIAKRNYSNEKIVELIYSPQPQNWPDYPTEMPPMPHVPKADALKIAEFINTLAK